MSVERVSSSEQETMDLAARLGARLRGGEVIALEGPLGAGKTCFVRGLARGLGLDPRQVSSPTFVICQHYTGQVPLTLVHVDAFRLGDADELEAIGWDEMCNRSDVVIAIEWPSRVEAAIPAQALRVCLAHEDEQVRRLHLTASTDLECSWEGESRCPICQEPVAPDAAAFPFCSTRCRMVDLGRWMKGDYRVGGT